MLVRARPKGSSQRSLHPSIKHMFVQSHLPVLNPVGRKVLSQAMFLIQVKEAIFGNLWSTIVDIYFAGEVHANTVLKDDYSNT